MYLSMIDPLWHARELEIWAGASENQPTVLIDAKDGKFCIGIYIYVHTLMCIHIHTYIHTFMYTQAQEHSMANTKVNILILYNFILDMDQRN